MTVCTAVKSKGNIWQNFLAFSEYMNFTTKRDCSGVQKQGLSPDGWQRGYHNFQLNYVKDSSSLFLFCLQTLVEILIIYIIEWGTSRKWQMKRLMARVVFKCVQRNTLASWFQGWKGNVNKVYCLTRSLPYPACQDLKKVYASKINSSAVNKFKISWS